jgi:Protein of unknown function (DUF2752)
MTRGAPPVQQSLRARRIAVILIGATVVVIAAVLVEYDPAEQNVLPGCLFHDLTGIYCPGCGSCRALHQLLNGRIGAALGLNPLAALALPFLGIYFLLYASAAIRRKPWLGVSLKPIWIRAILCLVIVYGALRNIPFEPFSWLAP